MEVASLRWLLFWLLNRFSSSFARGSTILFGSFERIHGRSVVFSESRQELGRCAGRVELYSSDIRGQGHCSNHVEGLGRFPGLLKRGNGSRGEILQEHH